MGKPYIQFLGAAKDLKIFGRKVKVRAGIASINGLSAHGDSDDIMKWLRSAKKKPKRVFLVHGEEEGLAAMSKRIGSELKLKHSVPSYLQKATL